MNEIDNITALLAKTEFEDPELDLIATAQSAQAVSEATRRLHDRGRMALTALGGSEEWPTSS